MTDLQIEKIRQQVARKYEINADDLSSKSALSDTVRIARGEFCYRVRDELKVDWWIIAEAFNRKHYSSAVDMATKYAEHNGLTPVCGRVTPMNDEERRQRDLANHRRAQRARTKRRQEERQAERDANWETMSLAMRDSLRHRILLECSDRMSMIGPLHELGYQRADATDLVMRLIPEFVGITRHARKSTARRLLGSEARHAPKPKLAEPKPKGKSCTKVKGWRDGETVYCGAETKRRFCWDCDFAEIKKEYGDFDARRIADIRHGSEFERIAS